MKKVRSKKTRYVFALIAGVITGVVTVAVGRWNYAALAGWDVAALVIFAIIALDMHGADTTRTATVARRDDMNHSLSDGIVLTASLVSLGAVVYLLASTDTSILHVVFGLGSIVISWATVHMLYALRYAAMYYSDPEGGVDFNDGEKPQFSDFVYLAFTLGMTYQVSDTVLKTKTFRNVAKSHALLSFVFGTAIIATTINFLASLSK